MRGLRVIFMLRSSRQCCYLSRRSGWWPLHGEEPGGVPPPGVEVDHGKTSKLAAGWEMGLPPISEALQEAGI